MYLVEWYDIEGDAGWGEPPTEPPLVVEPAFILSWPRKNQRVPSYRICHAWCEEEPGGGQIIPAAVVKGKPHRLLDVNVTYRKRDEIEQ
jgi:hypothetical protein